MVDPLTSAGAQDATPAGPDWFTHNILPDGRQICTIRRSDGRSGQGVLDADATELLQTLLTEFAKDDTIPYADARQIVLGAFNICARHPL